MINKTPNFDFVKNSKYWLIGYVCVIVIGAILFGVFGAKLSTDFKGGAIFSYSFTGEIQPEKAQEIIEKQLKKDVTVTVSTGFNTEAKNLNVTLVADEAVSAETQGSVLEQLEKTFKSNNLKISTSNSVSPTVAGNFFLKCLISVLVASLLVILYVGIRFRKIGGVSAGMFALLALLFDCLIAFISCIVFRFEIDSNFMTVILTILGYSLNDTIIIYDRLRENTKLYPSMDLKERVNSSINQTLGRTIKTTIATFLAIITIVVVAEFFGLSSLRSFAIPMAVGILSGCISSVSLSCPLWYFWRKRKLDKKNAQ